MQLIPDPRFDLGIALLSQKDHSSNDEIKTVMTRNLSDGGEAKDASWLLCQWDSGPCLARMLAESDANVITDGRCRIFAYERESDTITLALDSSLYYGGKPAKQGDFWPHLLIEQRSFDYDGRSENEKRYFRCDADRMMLSLDLRLTEYELSPHPDNWVEAAQFLLYFYVKGIETHDFCWFGLRLFDNRWELSDPYCAYDGGKPDASHALIYSIGSRDLFSPGKTLWRDGSPDPCSPWRHIEIDLVPYLADMLRRGREDGYFRADSLSGLKIDGMNMGWETIASFRHTMEVRGLRLDSQIK